MWICKKIMGAGEMWNHACKEEDVWKGIPLL